MPPCILKSFSVLNGNELIFPQQTFTREKNHLCLIYLSFYAAELPRPAGVVEKRPQVEPVVVWAVALGVIRGGQCGHFVSVRGILREEPLHFVGHLGGEGCTGPDAGKAGKTPGWCSRQHCPGLCELTAPTPCNTAASGPPEGRSGPVPLLGLGQRMSFEDAGS